MNRMFGLSCVPAVALVADRASIIIAPARHVIVAILFIILTSYILLFACAFREVCTSYKGDGGFSKPFTQGNVPLFGVV